MNDLAQRPTRSLLADLKQLLERRRRMWLGRSSGASAETRDSLVEELRRRGIFPDLR